MLFTDSGSGRAAELAGEVGGEALATNAELASAPTSSSSRSSRRRSSAAAEELGAPPAVVSLLGATPLTDCPRRLPGADERRAGDAERRGRGAPGRALRRR